MTQLSRPRTSSDAASKRMKATRGRDTAPEMALRRELHRQGYRYFVDRRISPGLRTRPDIIFSRSRVAVYVDGCFWHGCPTHGTEAQNNAEFWSTKIVENRRRDQRNAQLLSDEGWCVIRAWEHEPPHEVAARIIAVVEERRLTRGGTKSRPSLRSPERCGQ